MTYGKQRKENKQTEQSWLPLGFWRIRPDTYCRLDRGLMTKEGKIVTPPVFWSLTAISKNLYLCKYDTSSEHGILLNEKGERIK